MSRMFCAAITAVAVGLSVAVVSCPLRAGAAGPAGSPADVDDFHTDARYAKYYQQKIVWQENCFEDDGDKFQCARVLAPIDWHHPDKGDFSLGISRMLVDGKPLNNPRLLLANPGGPGQSGLTYASYVAYRFGMLKTHTPIDIDPRGVGASNQITCSEPPTRPGSPGADGDSRGATIAESREQAKWWTDLGHNCRSSNDFSRYMSTDQTVRDFNLVRAVLGFATVDFYGASYGSFFGAYYAKAFPKTTDRIVLDAVLGFERPMHESATAMMSGDQLAFDRVVLPWLGRHNTEYGLGASANAVNETYEAIRAWLKKPGAPISPDILDNSVSAAGFNRRNLPKLGDQLKKLNDAMKAGTTVSPTILPQRELHAESSFLGRLQAFRCNDGDGMRDADQYYRSIEPQLQNLPFAAMLWNAAICVGWPQGSQLDQSILDRPMNKVLMTQNEFDKSTPYFAALESRLWAKGDSTMVFVDDGYGHTTYSQPCAYKHQVNYLRDGKKPDRDIACQSVALPLDTEPYEHDFAATDLVPLPFVLAYRYRFIVEPQPNKTPALETSRGAQTNPVLDQKLDSFLGNQAKPRRF